MKITAVCLAPIAYSRPGLEIVLEHCVITDVGASALAEGLGRNQGPTKLDGYSIDNFVLANGLRGNSSLKSLRPRSSDHVSNRELLAIADTLREKKGLVDLNIRNALGVYGFGVNDETWGAMCDSLKAHPTLEVLDSQSEGAAAAPAVLKSWVQAFLDMMKMSMSIHTIHSSYSEHELFQESVIPYLETNRFRLRVRAIRRTLPIPYRTKVLGRALLAARTDPNRF
jgi:hypothetical protein